MGCLSSKEDADDFDRPNIFQVVNIDDAGDELRPAKLEITDEYILLHQRGRTAVQWPIPCLKRYGYSEGVFSFELGRRSPTGAGIYAFKCHRAEELIQLLQSCLKRPVLDASQLPSTAAASTMALSGSIDQLPAVSPAQSTLNTDGYSGDTVAGDATYVNEDGTVLPPISLRVPPVPAQRRSRPVHNYLNTASVGDDGRPLPDGDGDQPPLYVNVTAQQSYVNVAAPSCGVNYAVLDLQRDGAIVVSPLHQPPSLGYATIDFDKTVALSRAVGDRTCIDVEATRRSRHGVDDAATPRHGSMIIRGMWTAYPNWQCGPPYSTGWRHLV